MWLIDASVWGDNYRMSALALVCIGAMFVLALWTHICRCELCTTDGLVVSTGIDYPRIE